MSIHEDLRMTSKTICWECAKAVGFCAWSKYLQPVPGWKTKPSPSATGTVRVIECPEFERDSMTIKHGSANNGSGEISFYIDNPPRYDKYLTEEGCYALVGAIGEQIVYEYRTAKYWKVRMARLKELKRLGWNSVIARMQLEERRRWRRDYQQRCREMVTSWKMDKSGDSPAGGENQGCE